MRSAEMKHMNDVRPHLATLLMASVAIALGVLLGTLAFRVRTFGKQLESDLESPSTDGG